MFATVGLLIVFVFAQSIIAAPSRILESRGPSQCDPFGSISTGAYTIRSNEWGAQSGDGSQCSQTDGLNGNSLAWSTTWNFMNNPNQVKSYTNVHSSALSCKSLSQYNSIPTSWSWSYTGNNLRANVAYDTFLSTSCSTPQTQTYEVMVWLADYGDISPLSDSGYKPVCPNCPIPTATPTINGVTFNLIKGTNGATRVWSFVAQQETRDFKGDLMGFYRYLASNQGLDLEKQVLIDVQAGSEVFTGQQGNFRTAGYEISGW